MDPLELCEEVERELGIATYPMNWPIGCGNQFQGVYDREKARILHFQDEGHARKAGITEMALDDPGLEEAESATRWQALCGRTRSCWRPERSSTCRPCRRGACRRCFSDRR